MKKLYQKSELAFTLIWIFIYCISMSVADSISSEKAPEGIISLAVIITLCLILTAFVRKEGLSKKYGLCLPKAPPLKMLFYLPFAALFTVNLWYGVTFSLTAYKAVIYVLTMLGVGYFEELIFRGFLFGAMKKDNLTAAIAVSSITFGTGHIINLFNGSGMELAENIIQIISAITVGFMFVMVYLKSKSLVLCILTHGVFNALSAFSDETAVTLQKSLLSAVFIILLCTGYGFYLLLIDKKKKIKSEDNNL